MWLTAASQLEPGRREAAKLQLQNMAGPRKSCVASNLQHLHLVFFHGCCGSCMFLLFFCWVDCWYPFYLKWHGPSSSGSLNCQGGSWKCSPLKMASYNSGSTISDKSWTTMKRTTVRTQFLMLRLVIASYCTSLWPMFFLGLKVFSSVCMRGCTACLRMFPPYRGWHTVSGCKWFRAVKRTPFHYWQDLDRLWYIYIVIYIYIHIYIQWYILHDILLALLPSLDRA